MITNVLLDDLKALGVNPYSARALLALLGQPGMPMTSAQLAEASGVPRTSLYGVCTSLADLGVTLVPTVGPAQWVVAGWNEVLGNLAAQAVRDYEKTMTRLNALAGKVAGQVPANP